MAKDKKLEQKKKAVQYTNAKETVKKTEEGGGQGPTSFKLPDGVKRFKFTEAKTYRLNIIPFWVGEGNPHADKGYVHYERTFEVHRDIGAEGNTYACLKQFGKRCPICEQFAKLQREGRSFDDIKELRPKTRQLYVVQDLDNKDAGLQVYETGYYKSFGEMLANKIKAADEEDNYDQFFHLDGGMLLKVQVEKDSFMGKDYFKPTNIEMRPRKEALPESLLDEAPCLDDCPVEMEYEELKKLFLEGSADAADEDEEEEGDTDTDTDDDEEEEAPAPKKKDAKKAKPAAEEDDEDEEEEVETDDDEEGIEIEADDEDEESEDEGESEESDDEDEEADDSEDEEEEAVEYAKGDTVSFKQGKKTVEGTVTVANNKSQVALVKIEGQPKPVSVPYAELSKVEAEEEVEDEEDEEVETNDDAEADDDEDDFEFEEDEDEEEEEPAPKKKSAKPAPAPAKKGKK